MSASFLIGFAFLIRDSKRFNLSLITNGNFLTLLTLFIIFILAPLVRLQMKTELPTVFAIRDWQFTYPKVNILVSAAIFALIGGSSIAKSKVNSPTIFTAALNLDIGNAKKFSAFLSLILVVYSITYTINQGDFFHVLFGSRALKNSIGYDFSNGYAVDSIYAIFGILSFWYFLAVMKKSRSEKLLLGLSCTLLVPALFTGNRFFLIYYGLVLFLINVGKERLLNKKITILLIILLSFLIVVPREARNTVEGLNTQTAFKLFTKDSIAKTFSGEDLAMAPALSILIGSNLPSLHGSSYIALLSKPIPRNFWPSKPLPIDTQVMLQVFPEIGRNTGFAFSAISEPYLNFGPIGVVIFFMLLGKLNSTLFKHASQSGGIYIYLNAWISGFMVYLMRGNLSMDIQRCVFPLLISLLPYLIFRRVQKS